MWDIKTKLVHDKSGYNIFVKNEDKGKEVVSRVDGDSLESIVSKIEELVNKIEEFKIDD